MPTRLTGYGQVHSASPFCCMMQPIGTVGEQYDGGGVHVIVHPEPPRQFEVNDEPSGHAVPPSGARG